MVVKILSNGETAAYKAAEECLREKGHQVPMTILMPVNFHCSTTDGENFV